MAELNLAVNENRKAGIRHKKMQSPKIDMTPMVDLGFLLITFFIFTSELTRPKGLDFKMTHEGPPMPVADSKSMTILVSNNDKLFYYFGQGINANKENRIHVITYDERTGVGKIIREKQLQLQQIGINKNELMIVIKPSGGSSYKNSVDILDEMLINNVTRYAIAKLSPDEEVFLNRNN
jgi:biopolymer transport protein ExbD